MIAKDVAGTAPRQGGTAAAGGCCGQYIQRACCRYVSRTLSVNYMVVSAGTSCDGFPTGTPPYRHAAMLHTSIPPLHLSPRQSRDLGHFLTADNKSKFFGGPCFGEFRVTYSAVGLHQLHKLSSFADVLSSLETQQQQNQTQNMDHFKTLLLMIGLRSQPLKY